jgi:hypothetical protein
MRVVLAGINLFHTFGPIHLLNDRPLGSLSGAWPREKVLAHPSVHCTPERMQDLVCDWDTIRRHSSWFEVAFGTQEEVAGSAE